MPFPGDEQRARNEALLRKKEAEREAHRRQVENQIAADARRRDKGNGSTGAKKGGCVVLILVPSVTIGLLTLAKVWLA